MNAAVVEGCRRPVQVAALSEREAGEAVLYGRHHQAVRDVPELLDTIGFIIGGPVALHDRFRITWMGDDSSFGWPDTLPSGPLSTAPRVFLGLCAGQAHHQSVGLDQAGFLQSFPLIGIDDQRSLVSRL